MKSGRLLCAAVVLLLAGSLVGCGPESEVEGNRAPLPVAAPVTTADSPVETPSPEVTPSEVPSTPVVISTPTPPPASTAPETVKRTVVETKVIPFKKKTVLDSSVPKGERSITKRGVNGVRRLTYELTLVDGKQTAKRLVKQVVATQPVTQITTVGTKVDEPSGGGCDPNYSGCVPIASDVDCAGGSGNGPEYVDGPVTVIGSDIYGLDADDDGIGCE